MISSQYFWRYFAVAVVAGLILIGLLVWRDSVNDQNERRRDEAVEACQRGAELYPLSDPAQQAQRILRCQEVR